MKKLLLMSILFATIGFPALAAREPNPRRGLRKALLYTFLYNTFYWLFLLFVFDKLE